MRCSYECLSAEADAGERDKYNQNDSRTKGKNTKQVCPLHIYVPAVVPAKLPGELTAHFQITDQIQIRKVVKCIPVHCPNYVPLSRNQYPVLRTADLPITLQRPVLSILEFPTKIVRVCFFHLRTRLHSLTHESKSVFVFFRTVRQRATLSFPFDAPLCCATCFDPNEVKRSCPYRTLSSWSTRVFKLRNQMLETLLLAVGPVATSLWIFPQVCCTQHDDAARTMYPASRVSHSAGSGYKHVQSSTPVAGRSSRSLGTVRCSKHCSSAEADASVHNHKTCSSRKKRMNYNELSGHCIYISRSVVPANLPGDNRTISNSKYQFKYKL